MRQPPAILPPDFAATAGKEGLSQDERPLEGCLKDLPWPKSGVPVLVLELALLLRPEENESYNPAAGRGPLEGH